MQNTVQLCCTETEMWFVGSLSVLLSSHQRISWNWRSRQVSSYLSNLTVTLLPCKRPLFSFCLLEWGGERDALPEPRQAFDVAKFRTSWLVNLVFSCQTGFPSSIIGLLIEPNPMYHATAILGLGSELYPSNIQHSVFSTKILLDSFILENAKIEQVKERLLALRYFARLTFRRRLC